MQNRKIIYPIILLLFILALIFGVIFLWQKNSKLQVVFFDVGQGDSILISEGNNQMLIDGGKDGKILLEKIGKYVPFWDRTIETVVETHPDQDHIGGLIDLFKTYKVETVLKTNMQSTTQTFKKLEEEIVSNGTKIIEARSGDVIKFSNGAEADVIFPFDSIINIAEKDTNSASVVVSLSFGENSFLFTGDLPAEQEKEIVAKNINVKANFLKVGHHGSKYSSSNEFLDAVSAKDGIVSVSKNNSYGHPAKEALERLRNHGFNILRTDEKGDIVYECIDLNSPCQLAF